MRKAEKSDGGPVQKWMRLLVEKWRAVDQSAAYPHAVPDATSVPEDGPEVVNDEDPGEPQTRN